MLVPRRIIVHHSATKDSGTVSWQAIRAFHIAQGWTDVGYHAGVEWVQTTGRAGFEALYGRSVAVPGAHTKGQNGDSLGICFVGNYDAIASANTALARVEVGLAAVLRELGSR